MTLRETTHVVYEYPLPRHLQGSPTDLADVALTDALDTFARLHVLVVQSKHLEDFLKGTRERIERHFQP